MMKYITVVLTILFVTYGQLAVKVGVNKLGPIPTDSIKTMFTYFFSSITNIWVFTGLFAGGCASLAWIAAMSKFELSSVYPLLSINFILVPLLSIYFFNEAFNFYKLFGILIIVSGIIVFSRGISS